MPGFTVWYTRAGYRLVVHGLHLIASSIFRTKIDPRGPADLSDLIGSSATKDRENTTRTVAPSISAFRNTCCGNCLGRSRPAIERPRKSSRFDADAPSASSAGVRQTATDRRYSVASPLSGKGTIGRYVRRAHVLGQAKCWPSAGWLRASGSRTVGHDEASRPAWLSPSTVRARRTKLPSENVVV